MARLLRIRGVMLQAGLNAALSMQVSCGGGDRPARLGEPDASLFSAPPATPPVGFVPGSSDETTGGGDQPGPGIPPQEGPSGAGDVPVGQGNVPIGQGNVSFEQPSLPGASGARPILPGAPGESPILPGAPANPQPILPGQPANFRPVLPGEPATLQPSLPGQPASGSVPSPSTSAPSGGSFVFPGGRFNPSTGEVVPLPFPPEVDGGSDAAPREP